MIGIWLGVAVLAGVACGSVGLPALAILAGTAWLALRGSLPDGGHRAIVVVVLVCLAGLGMIRAAVVSPVPSLVSFTDADRFEGRVVSPVQTNLRSQRFDLDLVRIRVGDAWMPGAGIVRVTAPTSTGVAFGDRVGLSGDLDPTEDSEAGYRSFLEHQRLSGSVFARSAWIERPGTGLRRTLFGFGANLADRLRRAVPGDSGILLGGLVVGDDSALSAGTAAAFRETGTSHITAVSGSNLALIVVLLMAVGRPVATRWRVVWLMLVVVAIWLYAWVSGLDPPIVRAALMASIALAARPFGRRPDYLTAAALSAAAMVLYDPDLVADVGFQLSLVASVALAALASGAEFATPGGAIQLGINGAIVAQLATLPITAVAFETFSPISVLVNLIIGPLVAVAFPLAFAGGLLAILSPFAGEAVMTCAGWFGDVIVGLVGALASIPHASVSIPALPLIGQAGLVLLSAVAVLVLSRDGRRWLRRVCSRRPVVEPAAKGEPVPLTVAPAEGIVPPGPHSLAAQDVTLSR